VRALLALAMALAAPGTAVAASPERVARALKEDPVYVERGADPGLSQLQAGRIRIRIARRDPGRIKVAVVKSTTAEGAEGTNKFANAVDHELGGVRGILLVSGGHSIHMVVSFSDVDRATAVLRQAVSENDDEGLAAQLIEGVTRLADVDPGRGGDIGGGGQEGGGVTDPAIGKKAGEVLSTVKLVLLIVGIAVALPFVLVALGIALRGRRRRREERDRLLRDTQADREQLVALGERITELDLDESMPSADPRGREAYQRAVAAYDRANTALNGRPTRAALGGAAFALQEGQAAMQEAERLLNPAPSP
jgi:hypothetical protein